MQLNKIKQTIETFIGEREVALRSLEECGLSANDRHVEAEFVTKLNSSQQLRVDLDNLLRESYPGIKFRLVFFIGRKN